MRIAGAEIRQARLVEAPVPYEDLKRLAEAVLSEGLRPVKDTHADYLDWCREVIDMPMSPPFAGFNFWRTANFNKTHLPMRSIARETQVKVRETAARLRGRLLIEYYSGERDLIIESLERIDATYRQRKREQSKVWISTIWKSSRFDCSNRTTNSGRECRPGSTTS